MVLSGHVNLHLVTANAVTLQHSGAFCIHTAFKLQNIRVPQGLQLIYGLATLPEFRSHSLRESVLPAPLTIHHVIGKMQVRGRLPGAVALQSNGSSLVNHKPTSCNISFPYMLTSSQLAYLRLSIEDAPIDGHYLLRCWRIRIFGKPLCSEA